MFSAGPNELHVDYHLISSKHAVTLGLFS